MKSSIKTLFVILAIVISFVAVQAVWAKVGPDCTTTVSGEVSEVLDHAIVVDDMTINGIPVQWLDIAVGSKVVVNYFVSPEGNNVACYLTIDGELIDLRPRAPK